MELKAGEDLKLKEALVAAGYGHKPPVYPDGPANTTSVDEVSALMGGNVVALSKSMFHFGDDLRDELSELTRVPWSRETLARCSSSHVLLAVPRGLSIRRMAEVTRTVEIDARLKNHPILDYTPAKSAYILLSQKHRRPYTSVKVEECNASLHTIVFAYVMGILAAPPRVPWAPSTLLGFDHDGRIAAHLYASARELEIGPVNPEINGAALCMYQNAPEYLSPQQ